MEIIEVNTPQQKKEFVLINSLMNNKLQFYIQPLNKDIENIFTVMENNNAEVTFKRWIIKNKKNKLLGRIAAYNHKNYKVLGTNFPVGGFGFFDCINDQEVANALFITAKNWLKSQGQEAMDGPINFIDRDKYWGLMLEGLHEPPMFGMSYNPPYYKKLFENFGLKQFYMQYYYILNKSCVPENIGKVYDRILQKPNYKVCFYEEKYFEKYVNDYVYIYNTAWAQHLEGKEVTVDKVKLLFKTIKPFFRPELCVFAYDNDKPIGMFISIKDPNSYFKGLKGNLSFLNLLRFLYRLKIQTPTNARFLSVILGVIPRYQKLGIDSLLIYHLKKYLDKNKRFEDFEIGWVGDWNPRALMMYKNIGAKENRILCTYRYIFDEKKHSFAPHPKISYEK